MTTNEHLNISILQKSLKENPATNLTILDGVNHHKTFKVTILTFAVLINSINICLAYGIIWFVKYATNNKRTLVNKILAAIFWIGIHYFLFCQYSDTFQFIFGPFSENYCILQAALKTCLKHQVLLYFDFALIVRYSFIFWVKNPAAVCEDYWIIMIKCFVVVISYILTVVIYVLPMRKPFGFYLCANVDPTPDLNDHERLHGVIELFSILLHITVNLRISIFKLKINQTIFFSRENFYKVIEKQSIGSITTSILSLCILLTLAAIRSKINSLSMTEINEYPNYYLLYCCQLILPNMLSFAIICLYYINHVPLRERLFSTLQQLGD